jgi:hypothetical protein
MVGYGVVAPDAACGHAALDRKASMNTGTAMLLTLTGFIDFSWFVWIRIGATFFFHSAREQYVDINIIQRRIVSGKQKRMSS